MPPKTYCQQVDEAYQQREAQLLTDEVRAKGRRKPPAVEEVYSEEGLAALFESVLPEDEEESL